MIFLIIGLILLLLLFIILFYKIGLSENQEILCCAECKNLKCKNNKFKCQKYNKIIESRFDAPEYCEVIYYLGQ